jgi:hypothetical protein
MCKRFISKIKENAMFSKIRLYFNVIVDKTGDVSEKLRPSAFSGSDGGGHGAGMQQAERNDNFLKVIISDQKIVIRRDMASKVDELVIDLNKQNTQRSNASVTLSDVDKSLADHFMFVPVEDRTSISMSQYQI